LLRFKHRLDNFLHGHDRAHRVVADVLDIVAFVRGGRRQHDVGVACRRRPLEVLDDEGFQFLEGLDHAVAVLVVAAAGQADLAEHGGEHRAHPVGLLAVLLALHRPAEDELGAVPGHQAGELADALGRHAADLLGPLGRLLDLVLGLAFEVGQEAVEAQRVGVEELLVVQAFLHQRVRDGEHQRHVGPFLPDSFNAFKPA
jgi:hypothetical protein